MLCCIFLLLFAQQSALTHALWHAAAAGDAHAAHAHDSPGDAHEHEHESETQGALCAYHAAFGSMLGSHHGAVLALAVSAGGSVPVLLPPSGRVTTDAVPAVSRGPPFLL